MVAPHKAILSLLLPLLVSATALPPASAPWTAHRRVLLASDNTTEPAATAPSEGKPTEQLAASVLKLLLSNLDHGDVRTIALKLLPEYTKLCPTSFDCEELHAALRRLYIARHAELQLALHRKKKLSLLLRRIQYMVEQSAPLRPDHSRRRRPGGGAGRPKLQRIRSESKEDE
jgi:hypothetical protein